MTTDFQALVETASDTGAETPTQPDIAAAAIRQIEGWIETERASRVAGLATTSDIVLRRRLLEKIHSTVRSAAPHQRPGRTRLAVAARNAATLFLSAAAEEELELLERSTLPADLWLQALADFSTMNRERSGDHDSQLPRIIAVLLLTPPPRASECGEE